VDEKAIVERIAVEGAFGKHPDTYYFGKRFFLGPSIDLLVVGECWRNDEA